MRIRRCTTILLALVTLLAIGCSRGDGGGSHGHSHSEHDHHPDEFERGPHRGRMLRSATIDLELQVFEQGVPPQFRIYPFQSGKLISPEAVSVTVTLTRLGRVPETIKFSPTGKFLLGDQEIYEPHSFDVAVKADYGGKTASWEFASYEGRTTISGETARASGIRVETVEPRTIEVVRHARGVVVASEDRIAHVIPRFAGVVRDSKKHIGDVVSKGELLAVIESNENLQPFEVRAFMAGTVIDGHVVVGEFVPENQTIYVIADIREVWVDLAVPLADMANINVGQPARIAAVNLETGIAGRVLYIAPHTDRDSQTRLVRVVVDNPNGQLLPGTFVSGEIVVESRSAPIAIRRSAVQTFRDWTVVFRAVNDVFEATPVELGTHDAAWAEVTRGLTAGDRYVGDNSFLIKADILKSGASHDH